MLTVDLLICAINTDHGGVSPEIEVENQYHNFETNLKQALLKYGQVDSFLPGLSLGCQKKMIISHVLQSHGHCISHQVQSGASIHLDIFTTYNQPPLMSSKAHPV